MSNYAKMITTDIRKLWSGLDLNQKFSVSALVLIAVVATVYFIVRSTEPNWSVLYADLNEPDIVSISESLKKSGYAYKISDDKKAILVPADKKEELRMYVAENDLIKDSSPGFELLDDLQLGSTDFKNKLTKQRIFQGELTRSIEKINGVVKARVQLAEPERSVFSEEDESPSASVILVLEPGYKIKASQVIAIKNLVAYSVPRLTNDRVFLTDQYGNMLSEDVSKNSNDMQSFKSGFEKDAAKKIKDTLETIMGKDNVSVQVSADLDFNSTRSTIESYTPIEQTGQGVVVSSQGEKETYQNPNGAVSETAESTIEGIGTEKTTSKNLNYEKEKSAVNYAVTKEVKQVVYAPGAVKRMTVAVAVNKILTPSEKEEIESLVGAAAGMDMERGDMINVSSLKFSSEEKPTDEVAVAEKQAMTVSIVDFVFTKIAPLLVLLVLGLVALNTFGGIMKKTAVSSGSKYDEIDYGVDPFIAMQEAQLADIDLTPQNTFDVVVEKKKNDLTDIVTSDPQEAARLLTSYIRD